MKFVKLPPLIVFSTCSIRQGTFAEWVSTICTSCIAIAYLVAKFKECVCVGGGGGGRGREREIEKKKQTQSSQDSICFKSIIVHILCIIVIIIHLRCVSAVCLLLLLESTFVYLVSSCSVFTCSPLLPYME